MIRFSLSSLICQTPVKRCVIGILSALVFTSCQIQKTNMQLLMKENTVSTVTNRLVVIFRIIVILLTCIILHFRSPSVSEVKLFMEHNRRGENKFCKMFLIVIIIRRTEGRLLPSSFSSFFITCSHHKVLVRSSGITRCLGVVSVYPDAIRQSFQCQQCRVFQAANLFLRGGK